MKSCPSCNLKYADDTLQFCLNDGTQLTIFVQESEEEPPTVFSAAAKTAEPSWTRQTNFGAVSTAPDFAELSERSNPASAAGSLTDESNATAAQTLVPVEDLFFKTLAFAPIVVALMQNYWQWLYMDEYNSFQFPGLLWNLRFWVWLILLGGGAALCILALRQSRNKGFAVVGLVILAINLLLCLAPRK